MDNCWWQGMGIYTSKVLMQNTYIYIYIYYMHIYSKTSINWWIIGLYTEHAKIQKKIQYFWFHLQEMLVNIWKRSICMVSMGGFNVYIKQYVFNRRLHFIHTSVWVLKNDSISALTRASSSIWSFTRWNKTQNNL